MTLTPNITSGDQAVSKAKQWLGTPYCWGGGHGGPVAIGTCVDCSGLVNQVYGVSGNTFSQVQMGVPVAGLSQAAPGDLVFFGPLAPGEPHHVGIYTGSGMMIDAPHTGTNVRYDTVANFGPINAIRRLVATASGITAADGMFSYAQIEAVWIQAGGSAQTAPMAAAIAYAESGGNSNASNVNTNGSTDRGLWQINTVNGSASSFDVMTNARGAIKISNNGTNWRPWCTAYSDGACGIKGGTYLGSGAPYQRFLKLGVPPDYSQPINGTNGAANQPQPAETTGFDFWKTYSCLTGNVESCASVAASGAANQIFVAVIKLILTPLIQAFGGILGIASGGILMLLGLFAIFSSTSAGSGATRMAQRGAEVYFPESRVARVIGGRGVTGGERTARIRQAASAQTGATRERVQASQQASQRSMFQARTAESRRREQVASQPKETKVTRTQRGNTTTYKTTKRVLSEEANTYTPPSSGGRPYSRS